MSTVWIKLYDYYEDSGVCGSCVFGSIEAVNADKMRYEAEAIKYVQYWLNATKEKLKKTEAEKLPVRLALEDAQAKLKEDKEKGIKNRENRKLNKQIEQSLFHFNEEIRKLENQILTYQHALIYTIEAIDMWLKVNHYSYKEYEVIP